MEEIKKSDLDHAHGMCQPLKALRGRQVDAVAVAGIGMGALLKLRAQRVGVYRAIRGTAQQHIDLIRNSTLPQLEEQFNCSGHAGGGCAHS